MHQTVIACRREVGTAQRAYGPSALSIVFPQVERLPWEAIADLRKHRDIDYFRKTLVDIEHQASMMNDERFDDAVAKAYKEAIDTAEARMRGSNLRKWGLKGFSVLAGELLGFAVGGPPVIGSVLGTLATDSVEKGLQVVLRPRWLAFDRALRERSGAVGGAKGGPIASSGTLDRR